METLPGARTTEGSGPSKCPSGWASLSPLPEEGVFKGVDLLVSITPPGLTLPLVLSLWKPGISFGIPIVTNPVSMGTPQFHISSPVAITTPGITSSSPNPGLCATLPITSVPPLSVALVIKTGRRTLWLPPCEVRRGPKHQGVCSAFLPPIPRG